MKTSAVLAVAAAATAVGLAAVFPAWLAILLAVWIALAALAWAVCAAAGRADRDIAARQPLAPEEAVDLARSALGVERAWVELADPAHPERDVVVAGAYVGGDRATLSVPLMSGETVSGWLAVATTDPRRRFGDTDRVALAEVADRLLASGEQDPLRTGRFHRNAPLGVLAAATLSLLAASPAVAQDCAGAHARAGGDDPGAARSAITCLINAERSARDLPALHGDRRLRLAAERHSADMVRRAYFAHRSPGDQGLRDRLHRAGYLPRAGRWRAGEVLAWGTGSRSTPRAIVDGWLASPAHREVLLDPRFDEIGVGVEPAAPRRSAAAGITATVDLGRIGAS